jgi:hypothetical protein
MDLTYGFVSEVYGEETATALANRAEYVRNPDPDHDPFAVQFDVASKE